MKIIKGIIITVIFISCIGFDKTKPKESTSIVYILPFKVSKLVKSHLDSLEVTKPFLCLHQSTDSWELFVCRTNEKQENPFVKRSNREAFILGKFYPIILESDNVFATSKTAEEVLLEFNKSKSTTQFSHYLAHDGNSIKFNNAGDIVEER
ncbi:MAG: hypothetical protein IPH18_00045 [Chitinophagaceae bacterium]|nr:hypothetical protein [Chitinophagaceae bacterium]